MVSLSILLVYYISYQITLTVFTQNNLFCGIYSNLFFRVDNVDQASQAKAEIEQKQRNEAEVRKENNEVWIPRVNKINNIYFK